MKTLKKILLGIGISVLSLVIVAGIAFAIIKVPTLTIDFSQQSELTGRASGFLYGIAEDDVPTAEIVESIGINTLATKPAGGLQHPIGDVNQVAETFTEAGGEYLLIYTQDMYDTWYYQLDSLELYNERVRKTVTEMENSEYKDKLVYCIYNEMDNGQWFGDHWVEENRYKFYDAWLSTYNVVKEINPDAKIAGPGHCGYNYDWNKEFLTYCKANNCMPNMFVWHELAGEPNYSIYWMEYRFNEFNEMCDELGVERIPICISEYGLMQTNGIPGESVKWISRLEASDIYGCVAYWRLANNLAEVVADDVTPNSNYWVYKFYADMKGKELDVTEWDLFHSNIGNWLKGKYPLFNKGFIGMASFDESEKKFYVLTGGSAEDSKIKIENIDEKYFKNGDKVTVKVTYVDFKGLGGAVYSPEDCMTEVVKVSGNAIKFTLPCERESQSYFIEITPYDNEEENENENRTLRFEAEDATFDGNAFVPEWISYASSKGLVVKGLDKESTIKFTVDVDKAGTYSLDFVYANGAVEAGRISAETQISINGNDHFIKFPSTIKDEYMECVTIVADLKKGKNNVYINVLNDTVLTLDFIDAQFKLEDGVEYDGPIDMYFAPLQSRNVDTNENAYSIIVEYGGHYKLSYTDNRLPDAVNGVIYKEEIKYLHRGYNKIVLDNNLSLAKVESAQNIDKKIYTITPTDMQIFNGATLEDDENTSSGKRIGWIASDTGSYATFNVNVKEAGYYNFTIEYANNEEGGYHDYNVDLVERYITFTVNGENRGNYFFRSTYSWETYKTKTVVLYLDEGNNEIKLSNDGSYSFNNKVTYAPNIGDIQVNPF
ncbi:MAG: carbohydrate-binding protein [Clostridia bacterium]|nr:carbohydrate-binding protein [Clostridia bacterium]